ncbi:MAG TPA: LysM peptidoglycan-binding domain-containing protein [Acetobacteraceae bacterium]|nr:LysM peptidoglycan-binding domain-containing protein [Acetobacteraceae bacterium]
MPPSRANALRPALLVVAGVIILAAAAGLALRTRNIVPAPSDAALTRAAGQPMAQPAAPPIRKPSFDVVRINPRGDAVMAGHAAPGSRVAIADGGKEIGHVQADRNGDWVFVPSAPLPPGARELTLAERAPDGTEAKGDRAVLLVVPQAAAAGAGPAGNAPPPLAVLTGPNAAPLVLTGPGQRPGGARLALGAAEYDEHGEIRLSGTASPGATVRLYVDNRPIGQAAADPKGAWSLSAGEPIGPGTHRLRLDQIAPNGTVAFRVDRSFTREQLTAAELPAGHIAIRPGQNLWTIARRTYGLGIRYTIIYQANRQAIHNPDLIYPGQVFALPGSAGAPAIPASSSKSR